MTDELQSYRIDKTWFSSSEHGVRWQTEVGGLITHRVLVPDTRLQAIADAPKCKHELIDRHQAYILNDDLTQKYHPNGAAVWEWCEGAPELRAAISALAGGYEIVDDDIEVGPGLAEALKQADALTEDEEE